MTEPIEYAFTNTGVFCTTDGNSFVINATSNVAANALGNSVFITANTIMLGNSTVFNTLNSTSWSGTANGTTNVTSAFFGNSTVNVFVNSTSIHVNGSSTVNVSINATAIVMANSTANASINTSSVAINNVPIQGTVIGEVIWSASTRVLPNFLRPNGTAISRTTYSQLFNVLVFSSTVTFTNGSADITWNNHGLSSGDYIKFYTTGSLPTNFTAGTPGTGGAAYGVSSNNLTTNTFQVYQTVGVSIVAGSAGSGTQTAVNAPWGDGDGSTTFNLPQLMGEFIRAWDWQTGIDANRVFGVEQLDQMQGHAHGVNSIQFVGGSGPEGTSSASPFRFITPASVNTGTPVSDGTNGTPRTGLETRPRNQTLQALIRYQ